VDIATDLCEPNCPDGEVIFEDPPHQVVYAGFPFNPVTTALMGPSVFRVLAPAGSERRCWEICETGGGFPNTIESVVELSVSGAQSTYLITLQRPITPGQVTKLTYNGPVATTGEFTSHAGNVDGGPQANADDILEMVNCCLNPGCTPEWGVYSCDIDGSGGVFAADLIGLIDLLNGGGLFVPAINTNLPSPMAPCP
jgi:hypothetical protein